MLFFFLQFLPQYNLKSSIFIKRMKFAFIYKKDNYLKINVKDKKDNLFCNINLHYVKDAFINS